MMHNKQAAVVDRLLIVILSCASGVLGVHWRERVFVHLGVFGCKKVLERVLLRLPTKCIATCLLHLTEFQDLR